jgi:hypothetical protein
MVAMNAIREEKLSSACSPYPLHSSSQSALLLRCPLQSPHQPHCINLVSHSVRASTAMSDSKVDLEANKMNLLLTELAVMKEQ